MEITVALLIRILSITFSIIGFAFNRKDKSNDQTGKENYRLGMIDEKLANIEKTLTKIEDKLDTYDQEIEEKVSKAIEVHVKEYHKG